MNALERWNQQVQHFESMMTNTGIPEHWVNAEPPCEIPRGCAFCDEAGPFDLSRPLPNGDIFTLYVCEDHREPPKA